MTSEQGMSILRIVVIFAILALMASGVLLTVKWWQGGGLMQKVQPQSNQTLTNGEKDMAIANPASVYCQKSGGSSQIRTLPTGAQYGVCEFTDGNVCEEWAMYKGECPVGGLKVSGYKNEMQVYCAITGGRVLANKNVCSFLDGSTCPAQAYFEGSCSKKS